MSEFTTDPRLAKQLDRDDPLSRFRTQFHLPTNSGGEPMVYFCGHSLGLQPTATANAVQIELDSWAERAVEGHFHGTNPWLDYHRLVRDDLAELAGAHPDEVVAMNSLTVNLHLMMASFFRPTAKRYRIIVEHGAFPSDHYAVASQLQFHDLDPADALITLQDEMTGEPSLSAATLADYLNDHGESVALILLPGVQYATGQLLDLAEMTRLAHQHGALIGFDLAHAIGNVPLQLSAIDCDFAVWCSYKYLNSGPGAVGGCYVNRRHRRANLDGFAGWWGHDPASRFLMGADFIPAPGADAWQLSNPPILALAPLRVAARMFVDAGIEPLRNKSLQLTAYLQYLLSQRLDQQLEIVTPSDPAARGCQLSLRFRQGPAFGKSIFESLQPAGIICDWREPDVIRVAPVPLYNRFDEVYRFVDTLTHLIDHAR